MMPLQEQSSLDLWVEDFLDLVSVDESLYIQAHKRLSTVIWHSYSFN